MVSVTPAATTRCGYARTWQRGRASDSAAAYVPLSFAPGEAYQFDWSHEVVLIGGATVTVKVAHFRLCYSRMPFVRAYPRETQEMVFDAHDLELTRFRGHPSICVRGVYHVEIETTSCPEIRPTVCP